GRADGDVRVGASPAAEHDGAFIAAVGPQKEPESNAAGHNSLEHGRDGVDNVQLFFTQCFHVDIDPDLCRKNFFQLDLGQVHAKERCRRLGYRVDVAAGKLRYELDLNEQAVKRVLDAASCDADVRAVPVQDLPCSVVEVVPLLDFLGLFLHHLKAPG